MDQVENFFRVENRGVSNHAPWTEDMGSALHYDLFTNAYSLLLTSHKTRDQAELKQIFV
jgi:hypothetical protein